MLPIVRPKFPISNEVMKTIHGIMNSGSVTNNGFWVQKFEAALTDYLNCPTIVFSSGQAALMTMLSAADVKGGEVICPSFTFCATPAAIEWAGATPVFCDIEPETLCIDWEDATNRMTERFVASVPVAPYGIVPPKLLSPLYSPILIDAAPAFGTTKGSIPYATDGTAMVFSFHATKPFPTMEGGALCSRDLDLLDRAKRIRNFGQNATFDVFDAGINGKMMEICAFIGLKQLETWRETSEIRKAAAHIMRQGLDGIEGLRVIKSPSGQKPIWTYVPVLIEKEFGMNRDAVADALIKSGVAVRKYYSACHKLSRYKGQDVHLPVTDRIASQVISLPLYNDMTDSEIEQVVEAVKSLQKRQPMQKRTYVGKMMGL